jgi:hypothetical protein
LLLLSLLSPGNSFSVGVVGCCTKEDVVVAGVVSPLVAGVVTVGSVPVVGGVCDVLLPSTLVVLAISVVVAGVVGGGGDDVVTGGGSSIVGAKVDEVGAIVGASVHRQSPNTAYTTSTVGPVPTLPFMVKH